jgi:hypothetical protein
VAFIPANIDDDYLDASPPFDGFKFCRIADDMGYMSAFSHPRTDVAIAAIGEEGDRCDQIFFMCKNGKNPRQIGKLSHLAALALWGLTGSCRRPLFPSLIVVMSSPQIFRSMRPSQYARFLPRKAIPVARDAQSGIYRGRGCLTGIESYSTSSCSKKPASRPRFIA